jgi:hypothetical protein
MIHQGGAEMREITLPDIKLPDGLRDMTRDDIVQAAHDARVRGSELQKKIEMPDIDLSKVDFSKIDLSKVELPKQITDRLPGRRRPNPLLPIAGIMAVGAAIAGVWWLFTSSVTGPRVRSAVNDLKARVTGESNDLVRYDNDDDLGSLIADAGHGRSSMASEPLSSTNGAGMKTGSPVGSSVMPEGSNAMPESSGVPTY